MGINLKTGQRQLFMVYALLIIATIAVFAEVSRHEFVSFDDNIYVTENEHVLQGLTVDGLQWAFTTTKAEFWHPLTWLSLMADAELYGMKAGGYHVTNLILHLLSTLLLFWLMHRMTGAVWPSAFVAALFALHPLHVESVAWIAERKDVLSAFFWMLTLCLYVYYTEKPGLKRYLPVLLSFACGLMSKSMLVTLPVIMVLLDYWPLGRIRQQALAPRVAPVEINHLAGKNRKPLNSKPQRKAAPAVIEENAAAGSSGSFPWWQLKEKIPFFVLSLVFGLVTLYAQKKMSVAAMPSDSRVANALVSYLTYLEKFFWPQDLAVFYPFAEHLPAWKVIMAFLIMTMISVAVIVMIKRIPFLFAGWFWYIITLLPVIGLIPVGKHALADRYTYLSVIGISIMLAWGIPLLVQSAALRKKVLLPAGFICVAVLGFLAWRQCAYWTNSVTLYERALAVTTGNDLAHYNLANALVKQGKRPEAARHYQDAVRINPQHYDAYCNLGVSLAAEGKYREAMAQYLAAIKINPDEESAYLNMGVALAALGRDDEAAEQYLAALKINPDYGDAHYNYANLLMKQNKVEEAAGHYGRAVAINRNHADAHYNLADILVRQGKGEDAITHYREVLRINPAHFQALNNLGVNLEKQRRHEEAISCYRRALQIKPDHAGVHFNLGVALGNQGDLPQAIEHFRRALELAPDYEAARRALKLAQTMQ